MSPPRAEQRPGRDPDLPPAASGAQPWLSLWRASWQSGQGLSASELLSRNPGLELQSNAVLTLAYDEYCRRQAAGESIDRDEFCRGLPAHRESVARLLVVHEYLKQHSLLPTNLAICEEWPEAGETIAGFELIDGLGLGAFARVYVAAEPSVARRRVAVKVSVEGAEEADILGKLSHPNIVQILSVRPDERRRWTLICMPYLGQATLDDVICQLFSTRGVRPRQARQILQAVEAINAVGEPVEPAPDDPWFARRSYVEGAVYLMAQLADGLAHAHAKGICHRDLKPSNVLLAPGVRPMLLDFNLAQDERTVGRRLGGTLPYMAPEQLAAAVLGLSPGEAVIDPRSDLFSLGVLAYELLSGSWPYGPILEGLSPDEFATELCERQRAGPTPLVKLNPDIDPQISALIQRCLAFDAADRPQTAVELAAALRQCLSPAQRLRRWVRARRAWAASATAAALALSGCLAYYFAARPSYGERELRAAVAALGDRDRAGALGHLEEAARADLRPESEFELAAAYYRLGKAEFDDKEYGLALEHFGRANTYGLDSADLWFHGGAANYRRGQYALAQDDFLKAQSIDPSPLLTACRGDCALRENNPRSAEAIYRAVLRQDLNSVAVFNNLGLAISLSGDRKGANLVEAERYFSLAIGEAAKQFTDKHESRLQSLFYNRAFNELKHSTFVKKKCGPRAKQDIRAAIECDSDHAAPWLLAAGIYGWMADEGDPDWRAAVDFMQGAIQRGAPFERMQRDALHAKLIAAVRTRGGFDDLLRNRTPKHVDEPSRQLDVLDEMLAN